MRQVSEAELVWNVKYHLRRLSATIRKRLNDPAERRRTEQFIAEYLVKEALGRFEVLADTPLPEGSDLYSQAAYDRGSGRAAMIEGSD